MAVDEWLGDDGCWYVQLAVIWPWYLPLMALSMYVTFFFLLNCFKIDLKSGTISMVPCMCKYAFYIV